MYKNELIVGRSPTFATSEISHSTAVGAWLCSNEFTLVSSLTIATSVSNDSFDLETFVCTKNPNSLFVTNITETEKQYLEQVFELV